VVTKKLSIVLLVMIGASIITFARGTTSNLAGATLFNSSAASQLISNTRAQASATSDYTVVLVTTMGNITIELFGDMPITSGNFKNLTQLGIYDGTIFHRVIYNFVIQGGDASGKGIIVPTIPDELPNKHSNIRGSVAMANTGAPNSATSQFYINLKDNTNLDSNYVVFGKVIGGMDVVDRIGNLQTDVNDRPLQDVTILKAQLTGTIPEFSQLILTLLFMAATLLVTIVHSRKRARRENKRSVPPAPPHINRACGSNKTRNGFKS
jgi:peptidylprolyl isomerase